MLLYSRKKILRIVINNEEAKASFEAAKSKDYKAALEIAKRNNLDLIPFVRVKEVYKCLLFLYILDLWIIWRLLIFLRPV